MTSVVLRESAVLVPVYRDPAGRLRLVLVRRAERGLHGGQLGFPGGKRDPDDASLLATALREAEEEIGLAAAAVEVLAELPVVDTRTTGFRVAPFLGRLASWGSWRLSVSEIADVLDVEVAELASPEAYGEELRHFPTWPQPRVSPFLRVGPYQVWGLTYRILSPLVPRLLAGEWPV